MCLILKFGMDPLHIMVVHKIIKIQISHILKIFYCVGNLKIVVIIVSAVKSFMKGVVGYAVKGLSVYPAAVISVDDFTHQPEILFDFICCMTENTHKIKIQDISGVQTDSVNIKLGNPETDHITDIVLNFRVTLV